MITKTVTSGQRSATATISEETRFIFSDAWSYFHVQNLGSGTVYISMSAGTAAGADGVIAIPAGGTACTMHGYPVNDVYVTSTASDMVQIIGANSAMLPFKQGSLGGGGGSSYILPKATETTLGGIKAKNRTTETGECAIDPETGKIYAPASSSNAVTIYSGTFNRDGMTLSQAYTDFTYLLFTINYYNSTYSSRQLSSMLVKTSDIVAAANNNIVIPYVVEVPPPAGDTSPLYKSFYFYSTTVIRSRSVADSNITVIIRGIN